MKKNSFKDFANNLKKSRERPPSKEIIQKINDFVEKENLEMDRASKRPKKKNKYSFFSKKKNGIVMAFAAKESKNTIWLELGMEKITVPKRNKNKIEEAVDAVSDLIKVEPITEEILVPILVKKKRSQVRLVTDEKKTQKKVSKN